MNNTSIEVGIKAIELYFPSTYVNQSELEKSDECIGKYTIGLGQQSMAICKDNEDINSICLTVTNNLLVTYKINPCDIGFLEVGTETIIDKSKSTKSVLMQLFEVHGNTDITGVDVKNACFGGTSALFHGLDWLESSNWDGRYALVVAGDIAVYGEKITRCTGGAGAIALLLARSSPDNPQQLPLLMDLGVRSHFMSHQWDFYKPQLHLEYPMVDGQLSIECYQKSLDKCFQLYLNKLKSQKQMTSEMLTTDPDNIFCFHSPFAKLVEKSFIRLYLTELKQHQELWSENSNNSQLYAYISSDKSSEITKDLEKHCLVQFQELLQQKIQPGLLFARQLGNCYTASLYSCIVSLFSQLKFDQLSGKRIIMFSYGSGLAACMFSMRIQNNYEALQPIIDRAHQLKVRLLSQRKELSPEHFVEALQQRTEINHQCKIFPQSSNQDLFPQTYYLTEIDEKFRRHYNRSSVLVNGDCCLSSELE